MTDKTLKCVQCGECMVQTDSTSSKPGEKLSRTGCVLFHDQRAAQKTAPIQATGDAEKKSWLRRIREISRLRLPSFK
jgi:hypothetical protein